MSRWLSLGLFIAAAAVSPAAEAGSFRCGSELAYTGDSPYEVKSKCGEPADVSRHTEQRRVSRRVRRACDTPEGRGYCSVLESREQDVVVERWTYDFGKRRFMMHLTFEEGRLIRMRRGSYGHRS